METNKQNNEIMPQIIEAKDSIKLVKNSKGYNWEIRINAKEGVDLIEQIKYVDQRMREMYGGDQQ